jgi:methionyl-tRNA synthetase
VLLGWVAEQAERGGWRPAVRNFTENWLREGLRDRAITRDLNYGVPIPAEAGDFPDKRIYVWFEAVIGYLSATIEWAVCAGDRKRFHIFWDAKHKPRAFYFLGKDNTPFHTIIWPAMLLGYNSQPGRYGALALPFDVVANEFLQLKGAKFSKSRGNAFYVLELLQHFDCDAVRYYLCSNMPERSDSDWTWPEFVTKVNDELVATLANYANRVLAMCEKNWGGLPPEREGALSADEWGRLGKPFEAAIVTALAHVAEALEAREFRRGLRTIVGLAADGNRAVDAMAPWALLRQGEVGKDRAGSWLRLHILALRQLAIGLQPFLPALSEALWAQLGDARLDGLPSLRALAEACHLGQDRWPGVTLPALPAAGKLGHVTPLVKKLDREGVLAEYEHEATASARLTRGERAADKGSLPKGLLSIEDFAKVDLRVGHVLGVSDHPTAERLYVLAVDLGDEQRQIVAGLRGFVPRDELLGQPVIVIANLPAREIRGVKSEGMLLAAKANNIVTPLRPAKDLPPGSPVS